ERRRGRVGALTDRADLSEERPFAGVHGARERGLHITLEPVVAEVAGGIRFDVGIERGRKSEGAESGVEVERPLHFLGEARPSFLFALGERLIRQGQEEEAKAEAETHCKLPGRVEGTAQAKVCSGAWRVCIGPLFYSISLCCK